MGNPTRHCARDGCDATASESGLLTKRWRRLVAGAFWPEEWTRRQESWDYVCRQCDDAKRALQELASTRRSTRAGGEAPASLRQVQRQSEVGALQASLSPARSPGLDESDGAAERKRPVDLGSNDPRPQQRMRREGGEEEGGEEGVEGDDDSSSEGDFYCEFEDPYFGARAGRGGSGGGSGGVSPSDAGGYDGPGDESGSESESEDGADGPPSRTSQPRPIYRPPPPPRKGEQAEMVRKTMAAHNLLLLNGQRAIDLGRRDPEALGRSLQLARDTLQQLYALEGKYAEQKEAAAALECAGLGDLHGALTNAALYGKYPLEHGVWFKLWDTTTNMYAEACFCF